jgi:hypothetical protein
MQFLQTSADAARTKLGAIGSVNLPAVTSAQLDTARNTFATAITAYVGADQGVKKALGQALATAAEEALVKAKAGRAAAEAFNEKRTNLIAAADPSKIDTPANDSATAETALDAALPAPALPDYQTAIARLEKIDDISILVAPEHVKIPSLDAALVTSCETLRDRVALLSAGEDDVDTNPRPPQISTYAAFYHPWINVVDPTSKGPQTHYVDVPALGHIAGIIARSDVNRGVHKAPANEIVLGAVKLTTSVSKADQDVLNPLGVNCIRDFSAHNNGIRLWGARTTSSDPEWRYLNVRRLFLFLERSIDKGTQWVVFEPNSDPTWAAVRRNLTNFLTTVWRSGALMGLAQEQAFFVKCDRTTMTEDDIDNGRLICVIGVAPVRPAEFVIFRISQKTLDAQA